MKIKKITVENLKAVSNENLELNGSSVIVTAGNRKGKSTVLNELIERFRGEIPDKIVKEGQNNGSYIMELTDGGIIEWNFTQKTEKFSYTTPDGLVMKNGVISGLSRKYFGVKFDIDKFILSSSTEQTKQLAKIVGIDFENIDSRYKVAYQARTEASRDLKNIIAKALKEPEKVEKPEIDKLKTKLQEIKEHNNKLQKEYTVKNKAFQEEIIDFNSKQQEIKNSRERIEDSYFLFIKHKLGFWDDCINWDAVDKKYSERIIEQEQKPLTSLPEPNYLPEDKINKQIEDAQDQLRKFDNYESLKKQYDEWIKEGKEARKIANKCDEDVKAVEQEKKDLITSANIPEGFEFSESGLLYNGFELSDKSISTSEKYIAGLKLGILSLGELETIHFDASALDKNSLNEVLKFAEDNNIQLLLERPDFEGSEIIKYEII